MNLPENVTLRLVTYVAGPTLVVQHDGTDVDVHSFEAMDDPSAVLKAAEVALRSLGYIPDIDGMYMDMSLMVLNLRRPEGAF